MKQDLHPDPIPRPATGTADPAALAAQINAESEPKDALHALKVENARLKHEVEQIKRGNREMAEAALREGEQVKVLQNKRKRALVRARGRQPTTARATALKKDLDKATAKLQTARAWQATAHQKQDALNAARKALLAAGVDAMGQPLADGIAALAQQRTAQRQRALQRARARGRVRLEIPTAETVQIAGLQRQIADLLAQIRDLKSGLSDVRRAIVVAYPDGDRLALPARIESLGKERDLYQARAERAEERLRAISRHEAHAAQKVADSDPTIPFPMTADPGGSHVPQHV